MKVLDLFSGIGGFSLGLERTGGFETVAFCEINPFCRQVLAKHWPNVPIYEDIRGLTATALSRDGIAIDAICGGFPCQDISSAGLGAGIDGERSGLWADYARLIGELRPAVVVVENVSALLGRGMGRVLGDLAALGYDAEWHSIPASSVGAPHIRDRVWIVAYPAPQRPAEARRDSKRSTKRTSGGAALLANAKSRKARSAQPSHSDRSAGREWPLVVSSLGGRDGRFRNGDWDSEPDVCRVADGISINVDRVGALGNAVVPQIPELLGNAILSALRLKAVQSEHGTHTGEKTNG